jgi:hypothetical protein
LTAGLGGGVAVLLGLLAALVAPGVADLLELVGELAVLDVAAGVVAVPAAPVLGIVKIGVETCDELGFRPR